MEPLRPHTDNLDDDRPDQTKAMRKVGQVQVKCNQLHEQLDYLTKAIASLEDKLHPILRDVMPPEQSEKKKEESLPLVPLALELSRHFYTLESMIEMINDLEQRVEL